tara:strand:- start:184 stop:426 length:243 start_codon:yes stop_codon:yes gene_type:complete
MRPLSEIAYDIRKDWKKVNSVGYAAVPYLEAMEQLESIDDNFYADNGRSVVLYFLANASTWRGPVARSIKKELKYLARRI